MLQVNNLSYSFGTLKLLDSVSLGLNAGQVIAIVGPNGSGKSTLLKCIVGEIADYDGNVVFQRNVEVSYLSQKPDQNFDESAFQRILSFSPGILNIYREMQQGDYGSVQDYSEMGGYAKEEMGRLYAENFQLVDILEEPYNTLSLGQRRKVDIVGVLVSDADLVLMDEPINFLDIRGITAFEETLLLKKENGKAFVIISHDRELIDSLADTTIFLERGKLFKVHGGYSLALEHKEREFQARFDKANVLRNKIQALQEDMRRKMGWGIQRENESIDSSSRRLARKMMKRSKAVEGRMQKKTEELEQEKPWIEKEVALSFPEYPIANRSVAALENVSKCYGENVVLTNLTLSLRTTDRVSVIGPNGSGKTTLLRILAGEVTPDSGLLRPSRNRNIGYVPQGLAGFYDHNIFLNNFQISGVDQSVIRQFLGGAKLSGEKVLQSIKTLSYGELMRGAIVKMILEKVEFLLLDEPTAHLDIESVEVLEKLLTAFAGGFVLVSHDRRLISNVSDEIYQLSSGRLERM